MASKEEAQDALFKEIARTAGEVEKSAGGGVGGLMNQTTALRNLALAYRYAAGGPQPGGGEGSSK